VDVATRARKSRPPRSAAARSDLLDGCCRGVVAQSLRKFRNFCGFSPRRRHAAYPDCREIALAGVGLLVGLGVGVRGRGRVIAPWGCRAWLVARMIAFGQTTMNDCCFTRAEATRDVTRVFDVIDSPMAGLVHSLASEREFWRIALFACLQLCLSEVDVEDRVHHEDRERCRSASTNEERGQRTSLEVSTWQIPSAPTNEERGQRTSLEVSA
jgi:hypothetical protein